MSDKKMNWDESVEFTWTGEEVEKLEAKLKVVTEQLDIAVKLLNKYQYLIVNSGGDGDVEKFLESIEKVGK